MAKGILHIIRIRRRIKIKFIEHNKLQIMDALHEQDRRRFRRDFKIAMTDSEKSLVQKLRNQLGYSRKTNDLDIRHSLLELAREHFKKQSYEN